MLLSNTLVLYSLWIVYTHMWLFYGSPFYVCTCCHQVYLSHYHVRINTSEKTFRKNGMDVGLASSYKHREKRGGLYICVDHTINSTRGQERRGCKVGGRVLNHNLIYKKTMRSED